MIVLDQWLEQQTVLQTTILGTYGNTFVFQTALKPATYRVSVQLETNTTANSGSCGVTISWANSFGDQGQTTFGPVPYSSGGAGGVFLLHAGASEGIVFTVYDTTLTPTVTPSGSVYNIYAIVEQLD